MGPTSPNFWKIKIIILISRINIFVFMIYFSSNMIFFFSVIYNKMDERKNLVHLTALNHGVITSICNLVDQYFLFLDVAALKLSIIVIIILPTN